MNFFIIALIFTIFSCSIAQRPCDPAQNICQLGGYFGTQQGYQCIEKDSVSALCTCPGGIEENKPCRLCARTNPAQNVCRNATGNLLFCMETNTFGTAHACLCSDGRGDVFTTTDADCESTVKLTTGTATATTPARDVSPNCLNGAAFVDGICHCPSGYSGPLCADKIDPNLCERIYCQNNGTCVIQNSNGPSEGVCLCRNGTFGDYCELTGTLGFCSPGLCLNEGVCKENLIKPIRHAYCYCPAGYNGVQCKNRYFKCPGVGRYADLVLYNQGKYFDCTNVGKILEIEQKSCPKGLRYNANRGHCTY